MARTRVTGSSPLRGSSPITRVPGSPASPASSSTDRIQWPSTSIIRWLRAPAVIGAEAADDAVCELGLGRCDASVCYEQKRNSRGVKGDASAPPAGRQCPRRIRLTVNKACTPTTARGNSVVAQAGKNDASDHGTRRVRGRTAFAAFSSPARPAASSKRPSILRLCGRIRTLQRAVNERTNILVKHCADMRSAEPQDLGPAPMPPMPVCLLRFSYPVADAGVDEPTLLRHERCKGAASRFQANVRTPAFSSRARPRLGEPRQAPDLVLGRERIDDRSRHHARSAGDQDLHHDGRPEILKRLGPKPG